MDQILLADDDIELGEMLAQYLGTEGFGVEAAHDGETALAMARAGHYDLVILDVMMPRLGGFDVLRELRQRSLVPVLMLTARGEDVDSIVGLELGADDYLAKPCNPRVLVARVRAILRRAAGAAAAGADPAAPQVLALGDIEMQTGTRRVYCGGLLVPLTSTEYSVLEVLLRSAGRVVSKSQLSEHALGRELTPYDRSLDMHVSSLRRKLGPLYGQEERIKTVRSVGYQYIRP